MTALFGQRWVTEYGGDQSPDAVVWEQALTEANCTPSNIKQAVTYCKNERPQKQGSYAAKPPNLSEFLSIIFHTRVPDNFPSVHDVISEAIVAITAWRQHHWSNEYTQRIAEGVGASKFRHLPGHQLQAIVKEERARVMGLLQSGKPLPALLPRIELRQSSPKTDKTTVMNALAAAREALRR